MVPVLIVYIQHILCSTYVGIRYVHIYVRIYTLLFVCARVCVCACICACVYILIRTYVQYVPHLRATVHVRNSSER